MTASTVDGQTLHQLGWMKPCEYWGKPPINCEPGFASMYFPNVGTAGKLCVGGPALHNEENHQTNKDKYLQGTVKSIDRLAW